MGLLGLLVKGAVSVGVKPVARAGAKTVGALTSTVSKKAANTPLISASFQPFATLGFGLGIGTSGRVIRLGGVGKARDVTVTYGQAGQAAGLAGQTYRDASRTDDEVLGHNTEKVILLEEVGNLVGSKLGSIVAGGSTTGNYLKSMGPLLVAEGGTYALTSALSNTDIGQDLGFKEGMTFTEMNFETGKNLGTALLNTDVGEGQTFGEKSKEAWDAAEEKGSTWNPANYEWSSGGKAITSAGTYVVGNLVTKPLSAIGLID